MRFLTAAAAALLLAGGAIAQDGPGKSETADEAKTLMKEALEASAKAGGFRFAGNVDREDPFGGAAGGMGGLMGGDGISGKFSGVLTADGLLYVKVENDKGVYEVYRKAGRTVQRQTWTGKQAPAGEFAAEVSAIVRMSELVRVIDRVKDAKAAGEAKVGEADCRVVKGQFPVGIVEDEDEADADNPMGMKFKIHELKKIDARLWVGKDDKRVRKAEFTMTKGFSSAIRIGGGFGGDEEDEEGKEGEEEEEDPGMPGMPNLGKMRFVSTFSITVDSYDESAAVELPAEVKKLFQE